MQAEGKMAIISWAKRNFHKLNQHISRKMNRALRWAVFVYFIVAGLLTVWYFMGVAFYHHYYFSHSFNFDNTISLLKRLICWQ